MKSQVLLTVWCHISCGGCRGILTLITLRSERVKCRKALWLQAGRALWSNCKWCSQANRAFSCVRNMNCCFTSWAAITLYILWCYVVYALWLWPTALYTHTPCFDNCAGGFAHIQIAGENVWTYKTTPTVPHFWEVSLMFPAWHNGHLNSYLDTKWEGMKEPQTLIVGCIV